MKKSLTLLCFACLLFTGCATMFGGNHGQTDMKIQTKPANATIKLLDEEDRVLKKSKGKMEYALQNQYGYFEPRVYTLEISAPGYESKKISLDAKMRPIYLLANLFNFPIGHLIIDPATGDMYEVKPSNHQQIGKMNIDLKAKRKRK